jgi:hypothetical protein
VKDSRRWRLRLSRSLGTRWRQLHPTVALVHAEQDRLAFDEAAAQAAPRLHHGVLPPRREHCAARKRHGKKIKAKFNGTFQESVGEFEVTAREFDVTAPSRTNANFG